MLAVMCCVEKMQIETWQGLVSVEAGAKNNRALITNLTIPLDSLGRQTEAITEKVNFMEGHVLGLKKENATLCEKCEES